MYILLILLFISFFVALYIAEHKGIDKAIVALAYGAGCTILHLAFGEGRIEMAPIMETPLFLLFAILLILAGDATDAFLPIRYWIGKAKDPLLAVSVITFCLAAVIDTVTTGMLICYIVTPKAKAKVPISALIIFVANAGGSMSFIGAITTIYLAMIKQVLPVSGCLSLIPSMVVSSWFCYILMRYLIRDVEAPLEIKSESVPKQKDYVSFFVVIGCFLGVPVLKLICHLEASLSMILAASVGFTILDLLAPQRIVSELLAARGKKIELSSVLFILGLMITVEIIALSGAFILPKWLQTANPWLINGGIALLSAVTDNIPLVAAAYEAFSGVYPAGSLFWKLLAVSAGNGGSILIIGSSTGLVVMAIWKVTLKEYLKLSPHMALLVAFQLLFVGLQFLIFGI